MPHLQRHDAELFFVKPTRISIEASFFRCSPGHGFEIVF
ncbi:hypothetical protein XOC_0164 [Xanthomonas oryzae pv. oryzicola BLS256]|uniref:Uncharacterized protein n=1 Tax=Xanthomonas oryzae pv. oryzicola (strain BLS256) TaxID=383407 RepID=G7TJL5_XANOB|nr:hypothetical protein XOC_0164 [Xanthomonas oryzae pv. oryzicola BLS256]QEO99816.1 hypothetical protein XOCgx_4829 [Xanthomonas oryzae pv. oryzicola]